MLNTRELMLLVRSQLGILFQWVLLVLHMGGCNTFFSPVIAVIASAPAAASMGARFALFVVSANFREQAGVFLGNGSDVISKLAIAGIIGLGNSVGCHDVCVLTFCTGQHALVTRS